MYAVTFYIQVNMRQCFQCEKAVTHQTSLMGNCLENITKSCSNILRFGNKKGKLKKWITIDTLVRPTGNKDSMGK